jgi:hypothetical protein
MRYFGADMVSGVVLIAMFFGCRVPVWVLASAVPIEIHSLPALELVHSKADSPLMSGMGGKQTLAKLRSDHSRSRQELTDLLATRG